MAALSRSHAADRLDGFMSRFGPWELINYVPEGHSFTVALDGAKSEFVSVQLVPTTRPPKGAIVDSRFENYLPFVTDFAFNWTAFKKLAGEILGIPAAAIAVGVDTKGAYVLLHAIGYGKAEREALGRERLLAVADAVKPLRTRRPNPKSKRRGGDTPKTLTHTEEWKRIQPNSNTYSDDWLMRGRPRVIERKIVAITLGAMEPGTMTPVHARDTDKIRRMVGGPVGIKAFFPGSFAKHATRVATWIELEWQEMARQRPFSKARYAGDEMMRRLYPDRGMSWENPADREALFKSAAEPEIDKLLGDDYGAQVRWLYHQGSELEVEWRYRGDDSVSAWIGRTRSTYAQPGFEQGMRTIPQAAYVLYHLEAVVQALKIPLTTKLRIPGWDEADSQGRLYTPQIGQVLEGLRQVPPGILPTKDDPALKVLEPAGELVSTTAAAARPADRAPADSTKLSTYLGTIGQTEVIDPFDKAEQLLKDELKPQDFRQEDFVDQDPHFIKVRASSFIPPEIEKSFRDALKAKSKRRVYLKISPRFPRWASGMIFADWHRHTAVRRRRLMEVWVHLSKRLDELWKIRDEKKAQIGDYEERVKREQLRGDPGKEEARILQTQQLHLRGFDAAIEDLKKLMKKVRKKLASLGVAWAADPTADPQQDAKWAELWLKDKKWRQATVSLHDRPGIRERIRGVAPAVKDFFAKHNIPAINEVKAAIGRWQAKRGLREGIRAALSRRVTGMLSDAWKASGWASIAEDLVRMKVYAASQVTNIKDLGTFAGGVIQAPVSAVRASARVPIARLHDWLEDTVLPGYEISVRKLARRKARFERKFDPTTGETYFIDGATGDQVDPPRTSKHRAALPPRKRKPKRKVGRDVGRRMKARARALTAAGRKKLLARYQNEKNRWRSLRARTDPESQHQAEILKGKVQRTAEQLVAAGVDLQDDPFSEATGES
jgi:hypothetical protein